MQKCADTQSRRDAAPLFSRQKQRNPARGSYFPQRSGAFQPDPSQETAVFKTGEKSGAHLLLVPLSDPPSVCLLSSAPPYV